MVGFWELCSVGFEYLHGWRPSPFWATMDDEVRNMQPILYQIIPITLCTLPGAFPMWPSFLISPLHHAPIFCNLPSSCGPAFTSQGLLSALFLWGNSEEPAAAAQVQRDSQQVTMAPAGQKCHPAAAGHGVISHEPFPANTWPCGSWKQLLLPSPTF